ncbi:hypothetical protein NAC44_00570 [Allorhizobium sp. BGMRC 0089]|uniref:hypothetical protein n=1 Tax=Allorhizobium sonneratiae TaxID=2934936 RepID=UPI0020347CD7|nr:hypothetical protein [Allorhizobium sonneratiae]MCM2290820.1 hypothetical protein [Allorhizobium sonneratiae]
MSISKEDFFKPGRASSVVKAETTNSIARQIIATEAAQRHSKTERLRQLREDREAENASMPAAPSRRKRRST